MEMFSFHVLIFMLQMNATVIITFVLLDNIVRILRYREQPQPKPEHRFLD